MGGRSAPYAVLAASAAIPSRAAAETRAGAAIHRGRREAARGRAPGRPEWTWPAQEEARPDSGRTPEEIAAEDPIFSAYLARTHDLSEPAGEGSRWKDDDKLANLTVEAFRTDADAAVAFEASNDMSRGYGEQYGHVSRAEEIDGLGDEAWVLWASAGGQGVTYHWRRGNLLVEAHVDCYGRCPPDVDAATRDWVDAIDAEARE